MQCIAFARQCTAKIVLEGPSVERGHEDDGAQDALGLRPLRHRQHIGPTCGPPAAGHLLARVAHWLVTKGYCGSVKLTVSVMMAGTAMSFTLAGVNRQRSTASIAD